MSSCRSHTAAQLQADPVVTLSRIKQVVDSTRAGKCQKTCRGNAFSAVTLMATANETAAVTGAVPQASDKASIKVGVRARVRARVKARVSARARARVSAAETVL